MSLLKFKKSSGQGTIEYLVILAIVIVIGLLLVSLLSGFFSSGSQIGIKSDQAKLQTGSIGVTEIVTTPDGNYILDLILNKSGTSTITKIEINDKNQNYSTNNQLSIGEEQIYQVTTGEDCTLGSYTTKTITITYTTQNGTIQKQIYENIQIPCENININLDNVNTGDESGTEEGEETSAEPIEFVASCWNDLADPHPICNCYDLDGVDDHTSWNYIIQNDINFEVPECDTFNYNSANGFIPIDNFNGSINGNGKIIYGLYINRPSQDAVGLFGSSFNGDINDLGIINARVVGQSRVGSIIGLNDGALINRIFVRDSNILGHGDFVGGIIGQTQTGGTINDAYVKDSNIFTDSQFAGAVMGHNAYMNTYRVYSANNIITANSNAAGIVGYNGYGPLKNSFSTSTINSSSAAGVITNVYGTMTDLYWFDESEEDDATSCGTTGCTEELDISSFYDSTHQVYTQGDSTWDFTNTWQENENDFPTLKVFE